MYKPSKPFKQKIIDEVKKTWQTPYVDVKFNTYPIFRKKFNYQEVDHTDGIGTKGFYHWQVGTFKSAVIDALAMNLNDLAVVRAVPYKLSNHITVPVEDKRLLRLIQEMTKVCKERGIAIVGGENSFHDNMDGLDISMTVSGFVKKPKQNMFRVGDTLVGFRSSGLHSNGFTMVRKLFGRKAKGEFTVPTTIYIDTILKLIDKYEIHGMMHITGGAFTKLKDILNKADVEIDHTKKLQPQKIFREIYNKGISNKVMYSTFNCGIGFVIGVKEKDAEKIISKTPSTAIIGKVTKGSGNVRIKSAFNGNLVEF